MTFAHRRSRLVVDRACRRRGALRRFERWRRSGSLYRCALSGRRAGELVLRRGSAGIGDRGQARQGRMRAGSLRETGNAGPGRVAVLVDVGRSSHCRTGGPRSATGSAARPRRPIAGRCDAWQRLVRRRKPARARARREQGGVDGLHHRRVESRVHRALADFLLAPAGQRRRERSARPRLPFGAAATTWRPSASGDSVDRHGMRAKPAATSSDSGAVVGGPHVVAHRGERHRQALRKIAVVIDDQDSAAPPLRRAATRFARPSFATGRRSRTHCPPGRHCAPRPGRRAAPRSASRA